MCGRYVSPEEADIERTWNKVRIRNPLGLDSTRFNPRFNPNWNVAPTHQVPALRRADPESDAGGAGGGTERGAELVALRWGLIPSWAKGVPPKFGTIMATCERLATAPTWRGPWRGGKKGAQRCILPALGFYEWQAINDAAGRVSEHEIASTVISGKPRRRSFCLIIGLLIASELCKLKVLPCIKV